ERAADEARDRNVVAAQESDHLHNAADAASRRWEDDLVKCANKIAAAEDAENERRRQERHEWRDEAIIQAQYSRGSDYVAQTEAAVRDHERHREYADRRNEIPRPHHPDPKPEEIRFERIFSNDRSSNGAPSEAPSASRKRETEIEKK